MRIQQIKSDGYNKWFTESNLKQSSVADGDLILIHNTLLVKDMPDGATAANAQTTKRTDDNQREVT